MPSEHTIRKVGYNLVDVDGSCPWCKVKWHLRVHKNMYDAWCNGELIQDAFPTLTADERELLVSGVCDVCWATTFGGEG